MLAALALLGGCGGPEPVALRSGTQAAGVPPGVDGRYRGTARLARAADRLCPRSGPRVYELRGGEVTLAYSGGGRSRVPLTAAVQPDGRFRESDGEGTLEGQVSDGRMQVAIASPQCEHRWMMRRVP